jgi:ABC-type multidrug transport system fused ATPase/permease subunit
LARLPGGMFQMVGETGWRLSHGEKSRLYLARALLQRAEPVTLDESFSALDPQTLQQSMEFVLRHAPTLLEIVHP